MITIKDPNLEKEITWEIKKSWESIEKFIFSAVRYYKEIKRDNFLNDVIDTKINWKSFDSVEDLMKDLTD